jgi:hypothetical protein
MNTFVWNEEPAAPRARLEAIAMARIAALQSTLGWVVPMVTRPRAPDMVQSSTSGAVVFDAKQQKPKSRAKSQRVDAPAKMTAEQFFDARGAACRAVAADVGEAWHLIAGASQWCAIPTKLRSFTTARGTKIKAKPDARLPSAQYWPGGELPVGVVASPDGARDNTPKAVVRAVQARHASDRAWERYRDALRRVRRTREEISARYSWSTYPMGDRIARNRENVQAAWTARADWHALRGVVDELAAYVHTPATGLTPWVDSGRGYEVHPMLMNLELARTEQREADELRAIHLGYDDAVAERVAVADRAVVALCRLADAADREAACD